jgi:hypothetical protein
MRLKTAKASMWACCVLAVLLMLTGALGPTLGTSMSMKLKPAAERTQEAEDLERIQWHQRRNWFYGGAFVFFIGGAVSAFVALNRPPD